jgi:N-ethylmaleimide reductase
VQLKPKGGNRYKSRRKGGTIFAQLWHTGRLSHPDLHNGELPHAPSALNPLQKRITNDGFVDTVVPKE